MSTTGNTRLDTVLDSYARRRVATLKPQDVANELRRRGITSLEELIQSSLDDFAKGGGVARTTFIYEQFVYKESRVIEDAVLDQIEGVIRR